MWDLGFGIWDLGFWDTSVGVEDPKSEIPNRTVLPKQTRAEASARTCECIDTYLGSQRTCCPLSGDADPAPRLPADLGIIERVHIAVDKNPVTPSRFETKFL